MTTDLTIQDVYADRRFFAHYLRSMSLVVAGKLCQRRRVRHSNFDNIVKNVEQIPRPAASFPSIY